MNCMTIVSISLNDEILSELDKLQSTMGFSGRSEAIRAGIRTFVSEEKQNPCQERSRDEHRIWVKKKQFPPQRLGSIF